MLFVERMKNVAKSVPPNINGLVEICLIRQATKGPYNAHGNQIEIIYSGYLPTTRTRNVDHKEIMCVCNPLLKSGVEG